MTREDKELLLKDLSARLPYGIMLNVTLIDKYDEKVNRDIRLSDGNISYIFENSHWIDYKPYLRPMSSMTKEERKEYNKVMFQSERYEDDYAADVDWLNAHHFDYRGLIKKGLALEASEGMYGK